LSNTLSRGAAGKVFLMMFHHQYMMISHIELPLRHNYCIHVDRYSNRAYQYVIRFESRGTCRWRAFSS
jgi:hypothetical protein